MDKKVRYILLKMKKTIDRYTEIPKTMPTLSTWDVKPVGWDRYDRIGLSSSKIRDVRYNLKKLWVLVSVMCVWVLLSWCTSKFDDQAKIEIGKLKAELVVTNKELWSLENKIAQKKNHIRYLVSRIDGLDKYLYEDKPSMDSKPVSDTAPVDSNVGGRSEYQCVWEDFTVVDDDSNYVYVDWCSAFEWYTWCYTRKKDAKDCFKF